MTKAVARHQTRRREPLWRGPLIDGITFSLLCKFLVCRERFRLQVIEGLVEQEGFPDAMEFGSMFHLCSEYYYSNRDWEKALKLYVRDLHIKYPEETAAVDRTYRLCRTQFPVYTNHWAEHPFEQNRFQLFTEADFAVPYTLPSGREILMRGKIDGGVLLNYGAILFQEDKTKGRVDLEGTTKTLFNNLQTMFYQIAGRSSFFSGGTSFGFNLGNGNDISFTVHPNDPLPEIAGVFYNIVRRPLGEFQKHNIKQKKSETESQFYKRLVTEIESDPEYFFMRWDTELSEKDMQTFKDHTFHPIMEQLVDWWEWIIADPFNPWRPRLPSEINPRFYDNDPTVHPQSAYIANEILKAYDQPIQNTIHHQSPWGVYNSLGTGFRGDYFEYLTSGKSEVLTRIDNLFPELVINSPLST